MASYRSLGASALRVFPQQAAELWCCDGAHPRASPRRKQHASLVPLLGKSSGWDTDKFGAMQSAGFALDMVDGLPILG